MAKKNWFVKIMAFLALFWIIIWIAWTGFLIIFNWWNNTTTEQTLTPEQYTELQELINSNSGSIDSSTWNTETWSLEIK